MENLESLINDTTLLKESRAFSKGLTSTGFSAPFVVSHILYTDSVMTFVFGSIN